MSEERAVPLLDTAIAFMDRSAYSVATLNVVRDLVVKARAALSAPQQEDAPRLRENPEVKAILDGFHLTNGNMDAMNAALQRTFPIYSDAEAGTDIDGDAVTMLDALIDNGYVVVHGAKIAAALASEDAPRPAPYGPQPDPEPPTGMEQLRRAIFDHHNAHVTPHADCFDYCEDSICLALRTWPTPSASGPRAGLLDVLSDKDVMYDHPVSMAGEPMDPVLFIRWDAIKEHGFRLAASHPESPEPPPGAVPGGDLPSADELAQALTECAPARPGIYAEAEAILHELRKNRAASQPESPVDAEERS